MHDRRYGSFQENSNSGIGGVVLEGLDVSLSSESTQRKKSVL